MSATGQVKMFTLGETARRFGIPEGTFRLLMRRGIVKPSGRMGQWWMFSAADLPAIEAVLRERGYLKDGPTEGQG